MHDFSFTYLINNIMKKTFLEVMAEPTQLRLNDSQKRVMRKILDAPSAKMAAVMIAQAKDSRNLMAAVKSLASNQLVKTEPPELGPDDEPQEVELTQAGATIADDYDIQTDNSILTPEEQQGYTPPGAPQQGTEMPAQTPPAVQQPEAGLQLSSFFKTVNDLVKLID
jgi:hypothetical protein